jgi:hypothetical protein
MKQYFFVMDYLYMKMARLVKGEEGTGTGDWGLGTREDKK